MNFFFECFDELEGGGKVEVADYNPLHFGLLPEPLDPLHEGLIFIFLNVFFEFFNAWASLGQNQIENLFGQFVYFIAVEVVISTNEIIQLHVK